MWKGAISFGLVSIPVKVYPATEDRSLSFHQLHDEDHGRIRYKRVCQKCGEEVLYEHIVSGYEYTKGKYVVLTDEELEAVPVESTHAIDIAQFVDLAEIDPIYFQKSYYLVPDRGGTKAYHLLRRAMGDDGRVGIAKVAFRDKEHLAAIRLVDNAIVLETMYWPDEIREAGFEELHEKPRSSPQEVKMAKALVENLTSEFDPKAFKDEYREALIDIVERKVAGEEIETEVERPETTKVTDLMQALQASLEASKGRKPTRKASTAKSRDTGKRKQTKQANRKAS
jgi:DNA end-binding protein Ku